MTEPSAAPQWTTQANLCGFPPCHPLPPPWHQPRPIPQPRVAVMAGAKRIRPAASASATLGIRVILHTMCCQIYSRCSHLPASVALHRDLVTRSSRLAQISFHLPPTTHWPTGPPTVLSRKWAFPLGATKPRLD